MVNAHLLFREVVLDQAAHDLLRRPGCADVRGDQTAQDTLRVADPPCKHKHTGTLDIWESRVSVYIRKA